MSELNELLKQLSEAVPELCCKNERIRLVRATAYELCGLDCCASERGLMWQQFFGNDTFAENMPVAWCNALAIAAIRDWIVGQGWTVRCASGTYDGAILYMWEAGPTFHIEPLVECDNTDELLVAIDCALAVAKEKA